MDQIKGYEKDHNKKADISDEELKKITETYREMNPTNRYMIMSASGMLLASQTADREKEEV